MSPPQAQVLLQQALAREAEAYRLLLEGDRERAAKPLRDTAELYRRSWEAAGASRYGRLIGMLKAAVLAGGGDEEASYVREQVAEASTPAAAYALALAGLVAGDDDAARGATPGMRGDSEAFARTADAIEALADRDESRYADALRAIVADFEARDRHLTGVSIADTALVLERIAAERGIAAGVSSPLLPAVD